MNELKIANVPFHNEYPDVDNNFTVGPFQFTTTSLEITDPASVGSLDLEEWTRIGEFIRLTNQASQWWWGDWMNMGEDKFGEKASQALEITRWDEETLRQYAWVCRKVPRATRVTGVPFTHYRVLAKLPEAEQKKWAKEVVDGQLSRRQLKQAMDKESNAVDEKPCVVINCNSSKDADDVEMWAAESGFEFRRTERKIKVKK
jgi:hypothetical protein